MNRSLFIISTNKTLSLLADFRDRWLIRRVTGVLAGSMMTAALVVGTGALPASAGPLFTMRIDATTLSTDALDIVGVTSAPLSTTSVITISLPKGIATFNAGGGAFFCQPTVTGSGTWMVPASCGSAASGAGTATLRLSGLPITLDATGLSTGIDPDLYGNLVVHAGTSQTFRWMPQPPMEMVVGSALPSACEPGLAADGDATVANCGTSATASGPRVDFAGFPFSFDARALSTNEYVIDAMDLESQLTSSAAVHSYHLMAANGYTMQVGAAIVASFHWGIGRAGRVFYAASDSKFLSGYGTAGLVLNGLATTLNATGLSPGMFTLGPDLFGPSFNESDPQGLTLVPGTYEFGSSGLPAPEYFAWALRDDGSVGFVSGDPHPCAYAAANQLIVDCAAPTFTQVSGSPNWSDNGAPFVVTGRECDRVADVHATGTIEFTDLTSGADLGSVPLTVSPAYVNCGVARVTDHEDLAAGNYQVQAIYTPSGSTPVAVSAPASYVQKVVPT